MTVVPPPSQLLAKQPALSPSFTLLLNRLQPSPEILVLILAVLIGGGAGMGIVTFHYLIELIHSLLLENLMGAISPWGPWTLACVPTLGGVIIGLMRWRWPDFGPGISALIATVQGSRQVSPIRPITKMVAASVSLGSGASLGPEGPSVEIGANLGLLLGQVLRVSQERRHLLLGAGAAAGFAAGFNAPIAGVFFALEVVLGTTFAASAVSVVLLAAVVAALIAQIGLGAKPAFTLPVYEVRSPLELPLYLGLGLLACLVSIAYNQAIKWARQSFQGEIGGMTWLAQLPRPVHPFLGGAFVGLVALQFPQILGIGYETVEAILRDVQFSLPLLLALLVAKLLLTALSLGSGLVGGIFAPALFLGASLGSAYGKTLATILPPSISIAAPPAYAMVGMAAVLATSVRAPLTAILLLFELTHDYRIVLPLMAAVGLSVWLVDRLKPVKEKGSSLQQMEPEAGQNRKTEIMQRILVKEAMQPSFLLLPQNLPVMQAGIALMNRRAHSALVVDDASHPLGIITLQDVNRAIVRWEDRVSQTKPEANPPQLREQTVGEICTTEVLYAYKDEPVTDAL